MDEMNITSFSSSLSQTFFLAWRWKMLFLHCVLQCFMFFSEMVWSIELPFSSRKNLTFVRAETGKFYISHGTSSRIQHHPTHYTWRYHTPPTPPPPFCKQQRNLQRSNICQPSNIFQDSTSSNALHMTLSHPPHPSHPPSVNNNETCNVATSANQATSSRIQHHPTHFTWRYHTPPPPTPPSVNNNETCNVATSANQATSSRIQHHPTHFTWRYYTPPTPPTPPSVYKNDVSGIASRLRVPRSSGEPPALSLYIYIYNASFPLQ